MQFSGAMRASYCVYLRGRWDQGREIWVCLIIRLNITLYTQKHLTSLSTLVRSIVHPKIKLLEFTHPRVIPNPYDLDMKIISYYEHFPTIIS